MVHVLSAGEAFEDLVFVGLERLPAAGEEVRTSQLITSVGGGAAITAVALVRLGLRVTLASGLSVEADARLRRERGLRVINLRRPGEPHAVSAALSTTHERTFVTFDGVNAVLEPRLERVIRRTRASHVNLGFYPRDCGVWARRIRSLTRRRITTSWDFGWNDELARDPDLPNLMDALSIVFLNEREALLYSGASNLRSAKAFWRERPGLIVIKLGKKGSLAFDSGREFVARSRPVRPVDTTGAGDAFNGGFLARWLGGGSIAQSLAMGNRVGAASTQKAGGIDALPRRRAR